MTVPFFQIRFAGMVVAVFISAVHGRRTSDLRIEQGFDPKNVFLEDELPRLSDKRIISVYQRIYCVGMKSGSNDDSQSRYSIAFRGGDIVFTDGDHEIDFGIEWRRVKDPEGKTWAEYTLFAKTICSWRYPFARGIITDAVREHILRETARLLEQEEGVTVKINYTDLGGNPVM